MTESHHPGPLAPPPGHPDLDALADFDAGVLGPAESARVQDHVGGCARCRAVLTGIRDVPRLLGALPAVQLPPEAEARIFAALAAERGAARPGGPAPGAPAPVTSLEAARHRRRLTRSLGAAAAGLVLVAGGIAAGAALQTGSRTSNGSSAGPAGGGSSASTAPAPQGAAPLPSYDRETVTRSRLLTQILNGERGPLLDTERVRSCQRGVAQLLAGTVAGPLGVQHIRFEGRPAYLLAYRPGGRWLLVVVAEGCSATDPAVLFSHAG